MVRDVISYAKVKPTVLDVEVSPYFTNEYVLKYCRQAGIAVSALYPMNRDYNKATEDFLKEQIIVDLAGKYKVSPRQICYRFIT